MSNHKSIDKTIFSPILPIQLRNRYENMSSANKMSKSSSSFSVPPIIAAPAATHQQQKNKRKHHRVDRDEEDEEREEESEDEEDEDENRDQDDENMGEEESDPHPNKKRRKSNVPALLATSDSIPPPTPRPRVGPPMPHEDETIPTPWGSQNSAADGLYEVIIRHDKLPATKLFRERAHAMVKTTNPSQRSKQARIEGWTFQVVKQSGTEHFEFHASFSTEGSKTYNRLDYLRGQFAGILSREGWRRIDRLSTGPTKFVQKWGTHEPPRERIVMPTLYWWQQMLLDHVQYCDQVAEHRHYFWVVGKRGQGKTKCAKYLEQETNCCRLNVQMATERKKKMGIVNLLRKKEQCSNKALLIEIPFNEDRQADMEVNRDFYADLEALTDGDDHDINRFCVVFANYGPPPTEGDDRRVLIDIDNRFVYCFDNRTNKCTRFLAADENGQLLEHFRGPCFLNPDAWMHKLSMPSPSPQVRLN